MMWREGCRLAAVFCVFGAAGWMAVVTVVSVARLYVRIPQFGPQYMTAEDGWVIGILLILATVLWAVSKDWKKELAALEQEQQAARQKRLADAQDKKASET